MSLLALDARWRRLHDENRTCPCCGMGFSRIFDIGFDHPVMWPHGARENATNVVNGDDILTADLCRLGEDRFIRCTLPLAIRGSDEQFQFGVWGSIQPDKIHDYIDASEQNDPSLFQGGFSWLCNELPLFDSAEPIACDMRPDPDPRLRPALFAQDGPLAEAQENGISFDMLLDIYAACGQDIRPHLAQD
ncbi:MAG: DUF2199 domain-containing protein [Pelagimonas sp.]|nr:DUF2199 domain-containing protein [Pelagimonas sp.]